MSKQRTAMESIRWDAVFDEGTSNEGQTTLLKEIWAFGTRITFNNNSFMKSVMTQMGDYEAKTGRQGEMTPAQRIALIRAVKRYKEDYDLVLRLSAEYPLDSKVTVARATMIKAGQLTSESRRYLNNLIMEEAIQELIASGNCQFPE